MAQKVNRERILRSREKETVYLDSCTLGEAVEQLKKLVQTYGEKATLDSTCEQYSDSDKEYLRVFVDEPETDDEMNARIAQEERYAAMAENRDRREFERLQAKFGAKQ
jgi:siroheme synthase (precorrin-2 oxidase/ferrochelatase)